MPFPNVTDGSNFLVLHQALVQGNPLATSKMLVRRTCFLIALSASRDLSYLNVLYMSIHKILHSKVGYQF